MQVRRDTPVNPAVAPLLAAHVAEQRAGTPAGFSFALDGAALVGPDVTFFTAWEGDTLAGMGALKRLDETTGEVKSMRSTPAARGHGAGHAILSAIVAEARALGLAALYLETGTTPAYDAAVRLYTRAGFVPCGAFADYRPSPHNRFFRLAL
ncbi:GNAT family N-acetyltransferase [Sphingomonas sp. RHCKR47]|uniref:GNAT family N-acetyltransferase n=1 Tax=Sphingomonas citricola TaxID=2862498 RepID=UPI001C67F958|nr:GNAT family N-acetyltransferase [Sphingomonas citricola]MBW6522561.1 GNAT family N-acetyltransferase [Sphingomonas citricola]